MISTNHKYKNTIIIGKYVETSASLRNNHYTTDVYR